MHSQTPCIILFAIPYKLPATTKPLADGTIAVHQFHFEGTELFCFMPRVSVACPVPFGGFQRPASTKRDDLDHQVLRKQFSDVFCQTHEAI
jgi:hypothetical protein